MNILELTIDNKQINEVLKDDLFIQSFELANETGYVAEEVFNLVSESESVL